MSEHAGDEPRHNPDTRTETDANNYTPEDLDEYGLTARAIFFWVLVIAFSLLGVCVLVSVVLALLNG